MSSTPIAYRVPEACRVAGIGRTTLYGLIRAGALRAVKQGRITLIMHDDLCQTLGSLPAIPSANAHQDKSGGAPSGPTLIERATAKDNPAARATKARLARKGDRP
jgi:excisionase family DNA binding protein